MSRAVWLMCLGLAVCAGWACAGTARTRPAVTAAGTTVAAARDRIRRGMSAGSKPCTLGMVLPIETEPVRYSQWPCP